MRRAAYWLLGVKSGLFRPFVELSGGVAQVDAKVSTPIIDRNAAVVAECGPQNEACMITTVDAWKKTGQAFMSGGLGTMIAFGDTHGATLELRAMQMFGSSALGAAGNIGYAIGF